MLMVRAKEYPMQKRLLFLHSVDTLPWRKQSFRAVSKEPNSVATLGGGDSVAEKKKTTARKQPLTVIQKTRLMCKDLLLQPMSR